MPTEPRAKLGETPLVKVLRNIVDGCQSVPHYLQQSGFVAEFGHFVEDPEPAWVYDLTPAGNALLKAAELWDSLPEPSCELDLSGIGWIPRSYCLEQHEVFEAALQEIADYLEAHRREEATHDA